MKRLSRFISLIILVSLLVQTAFAEELVVPSYESFESEKKFSVASDVLTNRLSFEKFGELSISGDGLRLLDESNISVPVYIVDNSKSVQFSYINIRDYIHVNSDFSWKLIKDNTKKIGPYDWKKKMGIGGLLVQTSSDLETWETVYTNTNVFKEYHDSIANFYSAKRNDLDSGCYYRVVVAYRITKKLKQKSVLFIDTSPWKTTWNVDTYTFFIVSDESSATASASDYSSININEDSNVGNIGITFGNQTTTNHLAGEEMFTTPSGHGYAAEAANIQAAAENGILNGDTIEHTGANNAKHGSDYTITSRDGVITEIQSKYYNTPSKTLGACFDETGKFVYYAKSGVPMAIEVPADQYDSVLQLMRDKITNGQVPGVTDPAQAEKIIRKGAVTYKQAQNIAKAGTIDSLKYDATNSCISAGSSFGISAVISFAKCVWEQDPIDIALKKSLYTGLEVGGNAFATSILSSQLSRAGLNSLLVPGSEAIVKAIGPKASAVIVNATRVGVSPIYGAAAMKSAAKLLRGNAITGTISLVIFTAPDIVDIFRGRISGKQLLKNMATTAGGIGGGFTGAAGGATLGTIIFPGVGTTIGGIIGAVGGGIGASAGVNALTDLIAEDDADEMLDIINMEFQNLAEEYLLNNEEAINVSTELETLLTEGELKTMFSSDDQHAYARQMIESLIKDEIKKRTPITVPADDTIAEEMINVLEDIYDEADLKPAEEQKVNDN